MILDKLISPRFGAAHRYDFGHPGQPSEWSILRGILAPFRDVAGMEISEWKALNWSAFYSCIRVLSRDCSSLPIHVYRRLAAGGKDRATELPVYRLLNNRPNPFMTAITFYETMFAYVLIWGNAYAEIERAQNGEPLALWPLMPNKVTPRLYEGQLIYQVRLNDGQTGDILAEDMVHIPGLAFDGVCGLSPIDLHAKSIAEGLSMQDANAEFFGNASMPGGFIETPSYQEHEKAKKLLKSIESRHRGEGNRFRLGLLPFGAKWVTAGVPNETSQFLELRVRKLRDICGIFGVPPHKVGDLADATFSNVEHENISYVQNSLRSWLEKAEQELDRKLVDPDGNGELFCEFLVDALLRGDFKTRTDGYHAAILDGWLSRDEVREMENKNPIPDGLGQSFWRPVNVVDADAPSTQQVAADEGGQFGGNRGRPAMEEPDEAEASIGKANAEQGENGEGKQPKITKQATHDEIVQAMLPVFQSIGERIITKEVNAVRRAKHQQARDEFYAEHVTFVRSAIGPAADAVGQMLELDEQLIAKRTAKAAEWHCNCQLSRLGQARGESDIEAITAEWLASRPETWAAETIDILRGQVP